MNISFYNAVTGMIAYQGDMNVLSHNMANVNTFGYKPLRTSFVDLLYTQMDTNVEGEFLVGHGVKNAAADLIYKQSGLNRTDFEMDFAILGDAFFCVDKGDEKPQYTRNGNFNFSIEGGKAYLITQDGGYVLNTKMQKIEIPFKPGTNLVDTTKIKENIGMFTFSNPYGLTPTDGGSYFEAPNSGKAEPIPIVNKSKEYQLIQGALEFSGVDVSQEMAAVIQTQRAFQINSKIVQTSDEIEQVVNNLR